MQAASKKPTYKPYYEKTSAIWDPMSCTESTDIFALLPLTRFSKSLSTRTLSQLSIHCFFKSRLIFVNFKTIIFARYTAETTFNCKLTMGFWCSELNSGIPKLQGCEIRFFFVGLRAHCRASANCMHLLFYTNYSCNSINLNLTRQQLRKAAIMDSAFFILLHKHLKKNYLKIIYKDERFRFASALIRFLLILAILINFKYTHTHKRQQQ